MENQENSFRIEVELQSFKDVADTIKYIRENHLKVSPEELAERLGKPVKAVRMAETTSPFGIKWQGFITMCNKLGLKATLVIEDK